MVHVEHDPLRAFKQNFFVLGHGASEEARGVNHHRLHDFFPVVEIAQGALANLSKLRRRERRTEFIEEMIDLVVELSDGQKQIRYAHSFAESFGLIRRPIPRPVVPMCPLVPLAFFSRATSSAL